MWVCVHVHVHMQGLTGAFVGMGQTEEETMEILKQRGVRQRMQHTARTRVRAGAAVPSACACMRSVRCTRHLALASVPSVAFAVEP